MSAADLETALASVLLQARQRSGFSVAGLADASGVSRAMISKIERAEAQPTAALLARLATALGVTLSELIARAEGDEFSRLRRRADQPEWRDPETHYTRRAVSPSSSSSLNLVDVTLPAGASVSYPAETFRLLVQQIWVLEGRLTFREGPETHVLDAGDCLELGSPQDCTFVNDSAGECRYLVAVFKTATRIS